MEQVFFYLGYPFVQFFRMLEKFGTFILFQIKILPLFFKPPYRVKETLQQMDIIGVGSLFVIALTAIFTGLVEAIQLYHGFHKFSAEEFMGYTIFVSISKELGPVFGALMLVSRAVSAMTAELGTMRVTEQIDAIDTLAVDSKKYLIVPRVIATTLSTPILVIVFVFLGNIAAYLISVYALGVNPTSYKNTITTYLEFSDIGTGIIKAFVFGYLISIIGTYIGYFTRGGARGVGLSTTKSVVYAAMTVFVANYFLSTLFLYLDW
ncbi:MULTISPECIES: ABC transporter permease [unclassified Nitratiruptor]|uniref:MlaE family ABC transporter permease n=1 Tax=unclassified Nitratiruptor TaxID=2624044 RepID=UPI0019151191|nr:MULTISPECIES: ABC transporter permease [unclassified Nitratiruptor]BCD60224.1 phospholipid/cholesterol/gamma-HCH transport system permease protein [Nitratiruptor sp. YY08-10]BCD64287.1 phospholipid/cholesterol/gamma-HCH transport system permease protein [Nitratiruptor sp. YY08-14]